MKQLRLLIIDDDPEISGYIKMMLAHDAPHFRIDMLESSRECLEYLRENEVDCILSDYQMPEMGGMELLETIRSSGSDIPFIFITGQGSEEVAREAFKHGANDYFTKDIGFAHFPRIINSIEQAVKNREDNRQRRLTDEKVVHLNRLYSVISGINKAIVRTRDRKALMENACRIAVEDGFFKLAWVGMVNPDDLSVVPIAKWGNDEGYVSGIRISAKDEPMGRGPVGKAIRSGAPYVVNDTAADLDTPWKEQSIPRGYLSIAAFPIKLYGKAVGAFTVYSGEIGFFSEDEVALMSGLAEDISFALDAIEQEEKRILAEEALKESERRYKDLVELSTDFIYRSDRYGNQLFMNDAAYRMLEASPEEVDGHPWQKWIHPEDIKKSMEVFGEMMARGIDAFNFENRFVSKSGKIIHVMHNVRVLRDDQGAILGTQGIARDITEKKLAEFALKEAEKERNAVFHMLTHDIRGPLSVIYGYGDILKLEGGETAKIMEEIRKAARRISLLIDDMLAISRLESDEASLMLQPVFAMELIEQAVKDCEMFAREKRVEIKIEVEPKTPRIYADSAQMRRAVTNLLSNAVNYNRDGGTALIKAGVVPDDPMKIFIEVSDDGDGISEEDLPRLFEKYYRGKNAGKKRGTGLGLAMVKAAVDAHGGKVSVSSRRGEGSKFTIILPVKPGMT